LFLAGHPARAQRVVDKMVATVSDGVRTDLITYSDLLWQLALEPNVPLSPPSSENLNRALQLLISQRLIALEAERLPTTTPKESEVQAEIRRLLDQFPSTANFIERLKQVGFTSTTDENFQRIIQRRLAIEKYLDFRFRSFVIITLPEEKEYYEKVWKPRFIAKNPGGIVPPFETVEKQINSEMTENRIENDIEQFLTTARERAEIVILNPV
jgi:hypothetical protein